MKEGELSMYYVKKHGGNSNHKWRIVLETDNREKAIAKFDKLAKELRQGTVEIYEDDKVIGRITAPRLRTRW
jgi:hypothetical protein